eukprot:EG_transcript_19697
MVSFCTTWEGGGALCHGVTQGIGLGFNLAPARANFLLEMAIFGLQHLRFVGCLRKLPKTRPLGKIRDGVQVSMRGLVGGRTLVKEGGPLKALTPSLYRTQGKCKLL